jgi:hypothetical protein
MRQLEKTLWKYASMRPYPPLVPTTWIRFIRFYFVWWLSGTTLTVIEAKSPSIKSLLTSKVFQRLPIISNTCAPKFRQLVEYQKIYRFWC